MADALTLHEQMFLEAMEWLYTKAPTVVLLPLPRNAPLDEVTQNLVLDHAPYLPALRRQFLEWLAQTKTMEIGTEVAQHIQRPPFDREFVDFGGRRDRLITLLDSGEPLIQISGPSGAGKTRLALEVLGGFSERWVQRSAWVDCQSVTTERELIRLIACSVSDEPGDWLAANLGDSSESRLVVLDGLSASLAGRLVPLASLSLRFIALSSEEIPGFVRLDLGALSESATEADDAFNLIRRTLLGIRDDLINIGRTLDPMLDPLRSLGTKLAALPIGISLTAGCLAVTPVADMDASVAHLTNVATTGRQMAPQQVDEFVRYLLGHLPVEDFAALQALGQLQGPFTLETAQAITGDDLDQHLRLLERVGLVQPTEAGFSLLDSVRRHLDTPATLTSAYRDFFVASAHNVGQLIQMGEWKAGLRILLDNLTNILWVAQHGDAPAVASMYRSVSRLMFEANLIPEFNLLVEAVRRHPSLDEDIELQIQLLGLEGANASMHRSQDECERLWTERLERSRELGNAFYIADTLSDLSTLSFEIGQCQRCIDISYETEAVAAAHGFVELVASARVIRARSFIELHQAVTAREQLDQVVELLPQCESSDLTPFVYQNAVLGFDQLGEFEIGRRLLFALLAQASLAERSVLTGWALGQLGMRYVATEDYAEAARCFVAAVKIYRLSSSKHYLRAKERLAGFSTQHGAGWAAEFEAQASNDLVGAVLAGV